MTYTNVPPYQPASGMRILKAHKYAIAQRIPGQGAVIVAAYKTEHEAKKARARATYHHEWASSVLERRSDGWVPVNPRIAKVYVPAPELAVA